MSNIIQKLSRDLRSKVASERCQAAKELHRHVSIDLR